MKNTIPWTQIRGTLSRRYDAKMFRNVRSLLDLVSLCLCVLVVLNRPPYRVTSSSWPVDCRPAASVTVRLTVWEPGAKASASQR